MPTNALYSGNKNAMSREELARSMLMTANNPATYVNALAGPEGPWGMDPTVNRLSLLPRYSAQDGIVMPQWFYDMARGGKAPGNALMGHQTTPEEAVNFGLNFAGAGLGTSAAMKAPAPGAGKTIAATVYHGSPHDFDRFDMSKIGTGEGKQQQGVGLYFAESRNVAERYADKESGKRGMLKGNLYTVDLPDDAIASMVDYDSPVSKQPKIVRDAINNLLTPEAKLNLFNYYGWESVDDAPAGAIMGALDSTLGSRAAVSSALHDRGVKGVRYLDQSSRGNGGGTSNFVVFDDKLLKILIKE